MLQHSWYSREIGILSSWATSKEQKYFFREHFCFDFEMSVFTAFFPERFRKHLPPLQFKSYEVKVHFIKKEILYCKAKMFFWVSEGHFWRNEFLLMIVFLASTSLWHKRFSQSENWWTATCFNLQITPITWI